MSNRDIRVTEPAHANLMKEFEKLLKYERLDKEPKQDWKRGRIYQDGHVNELFKTYRFGYALGYSIGYEDGFEDAEEKEQRL